MNDLVDRILTAYQLTRAPDGELVADSRRKITGYIESLVATGQRDAKQLTVYGLAYLKELHEGETLGLPAARFSHPGLKQRRSIARP
jgi:hypothetical protein